MATRSYQFHPDLARTSVRIFAATEGMNQMVIEHLDTAAVERLLG